MRLCLAAACLLSPMVWGQPSPKTTELDRAIAIFKSESANLGLRGESGSVNGPAQKRKSQKSRWHGRLFENFRNNSLDAVPHEVVQRGGQQGLLRRNQFGFNLTGPVVIPKLYRGDRTTFFTFTFYEIITVIYE